MAQQSQNEYFLSFEPSEQDVENLIAAAAEHPLGHAYLLDGAPDSVAATFGVHAFVVDRARVQLKALDRAGTPAIPS